MVLKHFSKAYFLGVVGLCLGSLDQPPYTPYIEFCSLFLHFYFFVHERAPSRWLHYAHLLTLIFIFHLLQMSSSSSSDKSVSERTPQEFFERVKRILPRSALYLFSEEDFLKRYCPMARVKQTTWQPSEDNPHISRHITQGSSLGSS